MPLGRSDVCLAALPWASCSNHASVCSLSANLKETYPSGILPLRCSKVCLAALPWASCSHHASVCSLSAPKGDLPLWHCAADMQLPDLAQLCVPAG